MVGLFCVSVSYVYKVGKIVRIVRGISREPFALVEFINHAYNVSKIVRIVRGISGGGAAVCVCVCVCLCLSYAYKIVKIVTFVRGI